MSKKMIFYKSRNNKFQTESTQTARKNLAKSYVVYDLSIECVEERKEKAEVFKSGREICRYLQINNYELIEFTTPQKINNKLEYKKYQDCNGNLYAIRLK